MKTILVTGGAGFIGSHTCLRLLENKYKVCVIDSFQNSSKKALERVKKIFKDDKEIFKSNLEIFEGDLCNKSFLEKVFKIIILKNSSIDGVIHFAGVKSVSESIKKPIFYWRTNLLGTINLLEIMSKYNCTNFVFSGSATVYNQNENFLLNEKSALCPINPYGNTKLSVEILLKDIFQSSNKDFKFASLRYFNPIGAHPSGMIGEDPVGIPNNIFPLITNTALGIQKELKIFGNDWPTLDGTPIRDYIHVMDVAESHLKVLEYLMSKKRKCLNLNIGTGKATSVLELISTFEKVNNVKIPFAFSERRSGDACHIVADNRSMISKFKIFPKYNLEDMCRDGWKWKQLNPNGYR